MSGMRSSLAPVAHLMREPQARDAVELARDAYRNSKGRLVLINKDWLGGSWSDEALLDGLAEKALGIKRITAENGNGG